MQRWFFLSLWAYFSVLVSATAQSSDILTTEVSFHFKKSDFSVNPGRSVLPAHAELKMRLQPHTPLYLLRGNLNIQRVYQRVARITDTLRFSLKGDSLLIQPPKNGFVSDTTTLVFDYEIPWQDAAYKGIAQTDEEFISFNSFNIQGQDLGVAGNLFPSLSNDPFYLKADLTFAKGYNSGVPGEMEFITDNEDGNITQYYTSQKRHTAEGFYLVIGSFKEFEPEEIEEEFTFETLSPERVITENLRPKLKAVSAFYEKQTGRAITDSDLVIIDSLGRRSLTGFFITGKDLKEILPEQLKLEQTAALYLENNDTLQASWLHWQWIQSQESEDWKMRFWEEKWSNLPQVKGTQRKVILDHRLREWESANKGLLINWPQVQLDTGFVAPLRKSKRLPHLTFSYRYKSADSAQYINYSQDTLQAPVYTAIPVKITLTANGNTIQKTDLITSQSGVLQLKSAISPDVVSLDLGNYFPGFVDDQRPDTYNLYQLGNATDLADKREALRNLFNTKNPNLFSTALGIAMDDADPLLRLQALQKSGNLNAAAQQKLKDTILKLSRDDPDTRVRAEAQKLVEKYYAGK